MTDKKVATKRAPGRPKKPEAEQLEQFSIRLPARTKFVLEMVARHRRTSLSQAVEFLFSQAAHTYMIDGEPATKLLDIMVDASAKSLTKMGLVPAAESENYSAHILLRTEAGRVLLTPKSLQSPSERYFAEAYLRAGRSSSKNRDPRVILAWLDVNVITALYEASKEMELIGLTQAEASKEMERLSRELMPPIEAGFTIKGNAPMSSPKKTRTKRA